MIFLMSNRDAYGPRLMSFLYDELNARGQSPTSFARSAGVVVSQLGKWAKGQQPSVGQVEQIAVALSRPPLELFAIVLGDEAAPGVAIERTPLPTIDHAIENDPSLSDRDREILRGVMAGIRAFVDDGS